MSHCEVIYDDDGTVIATVHVTRCLTDKERAALAKVFKWASNEHLGLAETSNEELA